MAYNTNPHSFTMFGVVYSFEDYKKIPTATERNALRKNAIDAMIQFARNNPGVSGRAGLPDTDSGIRFPYQVDDIFLEWEKRVETEMEELERRLRTHDWHYEYSDDYRVWSTYSNNAARIRQLVTKLGKEAEALYDQYRPTSLRS